MKYRDKYLLMEVSWGQEPAHPKSILWLLMFWRYKYEFGTWFPEYSRLGTISVKKFTTATYFAMINSSQLGVFYVVIIVRHSAIISLYHKEKQ